VVLADHPGQQRNRKDACRLHWNATR